MSPVSSHSTGAQSLLDAIKGREWDKIRFCSVNQSSGSGLYCSWDTATGFSSATGIEMFLVFSWNASEHFHAHLFRENAYLERKFKMKIDVTS